MTLLLRVLFSRVGLGVVAAVAFLLAFNVSQKLATETGLRAKIEKSLSAMTGDRNDLVSWADGACGQTSAPFRDPKMKRADWGKACEVEVRNLATFRRETLQQSNTNLVKHLKEELTKATADAASARRNASTAQAAMRRMEKANASVQDNRVDGAWFAAANDLAGLRPPVDPEAR